MPTPPSIFVSKEEIPMVPNRYPPGIIVILIFLVLAGALW
jgi:hypothetical protein